MADIREIKSHIKGVNDTAKITRAMYMIASGKMRRAKMELDNTRPYFEALKAEVDRVFSAESVSDSPYIQKKSDGTEEEGPYGYLVITSDKGMAGYYNHGIIKMMEKRVSEHDCRIYMIGELGKKHCQAAGIPMEEDFDFSADSPDFRRARAIAGRLINDYLAGKISRIGIIYTDMKNGIYQQALDNVLLPFGDESGSADGGNSDSGTDNSGGVHSGDSVDGNLDGAETFEFFPSVETVLDNMVNNYVAGYIYSALVDSFCCEQSARMNAMDEANRNADEILNDLNLKYNHARQGRITQEITEVSSGARALKRKKKVMD